MATAMATAAPEILPHHSMVPRYGKPGATYEIRNALDISVVVTADKDGIIRPRGAAEVQCCDAHKLPAAPGQYVSEPRPGEIERGVIPALPEWQRLRINGADVVPITVTPEA
jgi:hypothetical protein